MGSEKTPSPVTALSVLLGLTIRTSTTSLRLFLFSSDRPFVSFCVNVWRFTGPLVFFLCLILVYLLRPNKNRLSWLVSLLNRLLVWSGNLERCHEAAVRFCPPLAVEPAAHLAEEEGGPQAVGRPRLEQQTARQAITVRYFSNWGLMPWNIAYKSIKKRQVQYLFPFDTEHNGTWILLKKSELRICLTV